ncbi:MAG: ATP-binding protein [Solirubrobacterales bacterium]
MSRPGLPRRWLPDSILARTAVVLVAAVAVSLAVAVTIFSGHRHEALAALGGRNAAERVAALVALVEETPAVSRRAVLHSMDTPGFRAGWGGEPIAAGDDQSLTANWVASTLQATLAGRRVLVSTGTGPLGPGAGLGMGPGGGLGGGQGRMMHGGPAGAGPRVLRISVSLNDGSWLNVVAPIDPAGDSLWMRPRFLLPLLGALIVVTLAALWAVRRATRPFDTFTAAAERLGVEIGAPPLSEDGPREVRRAAHAFNVMQARIRRFVDDRTQMLAAISHDLRTPITRLKLRAEFVEDEHERSRMLADLDEMERMIASTLAFARDDARREERCRLDIAALTQGLVDDAAAAGVEARYAGPDSLVAAARPMALKRALANLIDNAVKYGHRADVSLARVKDDIVITIADDGPGIPPEDRERVFAPFVRLEASRNRDTGGTGLGLAVARAAIRAHGGDIRLEERPAGGLEVTLTLPIPGESIRK